MDVEVDGVGKERRRGRKGGERDGRRMGLGREDGGERDGRRMGGDGAGEGRWGSETGGARVGMGLGREDGGERGREARGWRRDCRGKMEGSETGGAWVGTGLGREDGGWWYQFT